MVHLANSSAIISATQPRTLSRKLESRMNRRTLVVCGVSALVAGILACSSAKPATPVAPTSTGATAGPAGESLKVGAPTPQSPSNGEKLTTETVVLNASAATPTFATDVALQYRFQVLTTAGATVQDALVNGTT